MKLFLYLFFLGNIFIYPQDFWIKTNFPDTIIVNAINIETTTNTIYTGTYKGIYKSTNLGENWVNINEGITGRKIVNHFLILDSLNIYASTFDGLFKTTDGGQRWNFVQIGPDSIYCRILQKTKKGDFFLCTEGGIYRSTDNGTNWDKIFFTGDNIVFTTVIDSNNIYSHVAPMLYKSTDYGNSWKMIYQFSLNFPDVSWVYSLRSSLLIEKDKILFGTDGGIFYTPDDGNTFIHKSKGMGIKSIRDLLRGEGDDIFSVTEGDSVFLSIDYANNWIPYSLGLQNSDPNSISIDKNGYLFLGTWSDGIYKSSMSTSKFLPNRRIINFYSQTNNLYIDSILIKNKSDSTLIISSITVTDLDYTVTPPNFNLNSGDSLNVIISYYPTQNDLDTASIIFENNSFLREEKIQLNGYAGIPVLEIPFKTIRFGQVHTGETKDSMIIFINKGVDTLFIDSIIINNPSFHIEYFNKYILPCDTIQIKFTFSPTILLPYGLLPYESIVNLYTNNYSSPDSLILTGVGIEPVNISNEDKGDLSFELFQNFPNPFNPLTTIMFNIPKGSKVLLEVYNILGEKIASLINWELQAGSYKINFNGSEISSGVYFYKLKAGDLVSIKKFILIK